MSAFRESLSATLKHYRYLFQAARRRGDLKDARECEILVAPAMNTRMWENPIVQRTVATLRELGYAFVEPAEGGLACGTTGPGRMAEPEAILQAVVGELRSGSKRS